MSPELVLAVVGSAGFTALVTAIANGILNRKKLSADATKVITEAAAGVAADIRKDNIDLRERLERAEGRIEDLELERQLSRDVLQLHAAWDELALYKLRAADMADDLPQPPPLYPPPASRVAPRPA